MRPRTILLVVALILGVTIGLRMFRSPAPRLNLAQTRQPHQSAAPVPHAALKRLNYPYSVIPYGVQGPEDVRNAMAGNAEIARHFQGFDFRHAKFIVLDKDACAYVSFRKNGKIRWTQKCITLHRGELILTDGFIMIRALCGNQVSYRPQAPSAPVDVAALGPKEPIANPEALPGAVAPEAAAQPPAGAQQPVGGVPGTPTPGTPPVIAGGPPTVPIVIPPHGGGGCCIPSTHRPPGPPKPPGPPGPPGPPINVPDGGYVAMFLLTGAVIAVGIYAKNR